MSQSQGCCRAGFWRHYKLLCLLGLKKKNLQIGLSPVGKMYIVYSLLRNGHACLYHSSTSEFFNFGIDPPAIRDYFV